MGAGAPATGLGPRQRREMGDLALSTFLELDGRFSVYGFFRGTESDIAGPFKMSAIRASRSAMFRSRSCEVVGPLSVYSQSNTISALEHCPQIGRTPSQRYRPSMSIFIGDYKKREIY